MTPSIERAKIGYRLKSGNGFHTLFYIIMAGLFAYYESTIGIVASVGVLLMIAIFHTTGIVIFTLSAPEEHLKLSGKELEKIYGKA